MNQKENMEKMIENNIPNELYSDGKYLVVEKPNEILVFNLSNFELMKIITNNDDIKNLQSFIKYTLQKGSHEIGITTIIERYIKKDE